VRNNYAKIPIAFEENAGQVDQRVRYFARGNRFGIYLTREEVVLALHEDRERGLALALRFVGADPRRTVEGDDRAPGEVNYFLGNDPAAWKTHLPRYRQIVYRNLWPGIDLRLREESGTLKYEFHVRPSARPSDIRLAYAGATGLSLDRSGALLVQTEDGVLHDAAPVAWQESGGARVPVQSHYALHGKRGRFTFAVGENYDPKRELVIDPGIQFTTFLGGSADDDGAGIAVDGSGNSYIAGTTQSSDFPTTTGAFQRVGAQGGGVADVFVTKLNAAGTALVYSTFVGGSDFEFGRAVAIDASGNAYVTGQTKSNNFPVSANAFQRGPQIPANCPGCANDHTDGFVFKLNATGSALTYSTYLGGASDIDDPRGIAVDASGNAYVMGDTNSIDFPVTAGAFQTTAHGNGDMFLTKLNPTGSGLVFSTYIGGSNVDNGERVVIDGAGNSYLLGFSSSLDFPITAGAFQTTNRGAFDLTVTKVNSSGTNLVYSTYLGGSGSEGAGGLAVDAAGEAFVSGGTSSLDYPTTPGALSTPPDGDDVVVTKLNAQGSGLVYSAVFGGTGGEGANAIAIDSAGDAWITGLTTSTDYPTTANAFDNTNNGGADVIISELNPAGSALLYSTLLGGAQTDVGEDIALDGTGHVYVTGHTLSMDFPATAGAFDTVWKGNLSIFWGDAFVTKIDVNATTNAPVAPPATPGAVTLLTPANASAPSQPITFNWNPATSAAQYEIQIANSSAFAAPLVRDATTANTNFVANNLATTTQFWRVRGINSAGAAGPFSASRSFTPGAAPPPATLSTMSTNPSSVAGGSPSTGTVVLSSGAPDGGALIGLSSNNPAVASVPASTTAAANSFTADFAIATSPVTVATTVTITASYNGATRTATLTVTPNAGPSITNLALSPSSVSGGTTAQGAVILSSAADAAATVALSSSNPAVASVPASVTIAAGSQSGVFNITTSSVATDTSVTISATLNGATKTALLTVTAAAPPPQTATLTVNASGRSGARITSSPAGISVATGSSGSSSFNVGTSITLSAGRSTVWSGACTGNKTTSCRFTINAASTVNAAVQ
jgi:hypothetical protein